MNLCDYWRDGYDWRRCDERLAAVGACSVSAVRPARVASPSARAGPVEPERVSVAMAEIAESAAEGLLAVAVSAGLQVMQASMAESVTALAGPEEPA